MDVDGEPGSNSDASAAVERRRAEVEEARRKKEEDEQSKRLALAAEKDAQIASAVAEAGTLSRMRGNYSTTNNSENC